MAPRALEDVLSLKEAQALNKRGNVIPLTLTLPCDLDTPVSIYLKLTRKARQTFLLESIEGGEKLARYSFVGCDPFLVVAFDGTNLTLTRGKKTVSLDCHPGEFLAELFSAYSPVPIEGLPRFTGGAVGYFSYDAIRWVERLPNSNPDRIGMPEMMFGLFSVVVAIDHLKQQMVLVSNILHDHGRPGFRSKYLKARSKLLETAEKLQKPLRVPSTRRTSGRPIVSPLTKRKTFESMVRRAKHYIKEGDIFQVVLSQRWKISSHRSPLEVYRRLRRINPSPYMFLLSFGKDAIVGASPEMLVRVESGTIETRPIAGTRPRGRTERDDEQLIRDLLSDSKEVAEHTMLLDLGRNDVGRVSKAGSVQVKEYMVTEKYSHVIHIVSSVAGKLSGRRSALDGLMACFPAGTVSGAPKIRAMEIIEELEDVRRGVYAGAIAYIDFWGNLDSCIAIRTIVNSGDHYYVQAGAGIVADSKPAREFRETEAKAKALIEAITG